MSKRPQARLVGIEIQPADPKLRRKVVGGLTATILAGLIGTPLFNGHLSQMREMADPETVRLSINALLALLALMSLSIVSIGYYLWRIARRIQDSGRFPPPGMPVIKDTTIIEGTAAQQRSLVLRFLALFLSLSAVVLFMLSIKLYLALML